MKLNDSVFASIAIAIVLSGCATTAVDTAPPPLPASKVTCSELIPVGIGSELQLVDRELVPYSRNLLTVTADYERSGNLLTLVSGGTLDDHIEAYDDLTNAESADVLDGQIADVQSGLFFGKPVHVATWRSETEQPGCQLRAVIAVGMDGSDFRLVMKDLAIRLVDDDAD